MQGTLLNVYFMLPLRLKRSIYSNRTIIPLDLATNWHVVTAHTVTATIYLEFFAACIFKRFHIFMPCDMAIHEEIILLF